MQKHERETLAAAQSMVPAGIAMTTDRRSTNIHVVLTGPGGSRRKPISTSSKGSVADINHLKRWIKRVAREIMA